MQKLIKSLGYGMLMLVCWKCVDSTLCTSPTVAPVSFDILTIDNGEPADTVIDSLVVTGKLNNEPLDTNLIQGLSVTNGNLFLAPLEDRVTYTFKFHNIIDVDFDFFYRQRAEFLNDACGFVYEYTIDSLRYEQKVFSSTYTIPAEILYDTIYSDTDTTMFERIDTTIIEARDTTVQYGEIIDSVVILNPNILIDNAEKHIEIYIHPHH